MARAGKPNKSKNPDSRLQGLGASLGAQGPQSVGGLEYMAEMILGRYRSHSGSVVLPGDRTRTEGLNGVCQLI